MMNVYTKDNYFLGSKYLSYDKRNTTIDFWVKSRG